MWRVASKSKNGAKVRFSFGGEQAEADPLLRESFFETSQYSAIADPHDPRCFLIGRTGSGKSAMLQQLEEHHGGHVIRIAPEDLSLPYICDSSVVSDLKEAGVHLAPFFTALWKHVLIVEIIRHRYRVNSPKVKSNVIQGLREKLSQDPAKLSALDYLDEFEGKFWCEADERIREITDSFERKFQGGLGGGLAGAHLQGIESSGGEVRREIVAKHQKIVNETQLPRLNKMLSVLNDDVLDTSQNFTWVVIDDLDRDWVDTALVNELVRCLFRAVVDMKRVSHLKIVVALRTNIFRELDFSDAVAGQEEKFRSLTLQVGWSEKDMSLMLSERAAAGAARANVANVDGVSDVLPPSNQTRGNALKFVLRRTMMRPRDAISYLNRCCDLGGVGGARITWQQLEDSEQSYSNDRILALRDEWKASYPGLEKVMGCFVGVPPVMTPDDLLLPLEEVSLLLASPQFSERTWLMDLLKPVWEGNVSRDDSVGPYMGLIELLYDLGFIGVRQATPKAVFSQEQPELLRQHHAIKAIAGYVVHPIFWAGLGISRREGI